MESVIFLVESLPESLPAQNPVLIMKITPLLLFRYLIKHINLNIIILLFF